MAEVAVHLDDKFRAEFERLREARDVCAAKTFLLLAVQDMDARLLRREQTFLLLAVQDMDARLLRRERVKNLARSVGRVVVDEEEFDIAREHRLGHRGDVVLLVVCRYYYYRLHFSAVHNMHLLHVLHFLHS